MTHAVATTSSFRPQPETTLLIDADDTLWENNIYFLEVMERFAEELERHGVPGERARSELMDTERRNVPVHGYGSRAFALSVAESFRALAPEADTTSLEALIALARSIHDRDEMELLPGVEDALEALSSSARLVLVTKGDPDEQTRKVQCSGLARYFESVEVVREKDEATYRELVDRLALDPAHTWMVGNSPKSDINPALAAGLRAILVPHPHTWELEVEDVPDYGDRLVIADRFGDIVALFSPE
jgi:putative hydrolase of the HAD superfamily